MWVEWPRWFALPSRWPTWIDEVNTFCSLAARVTLLTRGLQVGVAQPACGAGAGVRFAAPLPLPAQVPRFDVRRVDGWPQAIWAADGKYPSTPRRTCPSADIQERRPMYGHGLPSGLSEALRCPRQSAAVRVSVPGMAEDAGTSIVSHYARPPASTAITGCDRRAGDGNRKRTGRRPVGINRAAS